MCATTRTGPSYHTTTADRWRRLAVQRRRRFATRCPSSLQRAGMGHDHHAQRTPTRAEARRQTIVGTTRSSSTCRNHTFRLAFKRSLNELGRAPICPQRERRPGCGCLNGSCEQAGCFSQSPPSRHFDATTRQVHQHVRLATCPAAGNSLSNCPAEGAGPTAGAAPLTRSRVTRQHVPGR